MSQMSGMIPELMYLKKPEGGLSPSTMAWVVTRYDVHNGELSVVKMRSGGDLDGSQMTSLAEWNYYSDSEDDMLGLKQLLKHLTMIWK